MTARWTCETKRLIRAAAEEHSGNRLQQYLDVQAQAPVLDVEQVHEHHLVEVEVTAPAHLPQPGNAAGHLQSCLLPVLVALDFGWLRRPWTDDAHVAAQHVEELRNLVQAGGTDKRAD